MIVQLQSQSKAMKRLLRPQQERADASYRNATWTIEIEKEGKKYIYNVLTKEFVCVQNYDDADKAELISRWFLVEIGFDEFEYVRQIKDFLRLMSSQNQGIQNYTIFTTTTCNARCYYCFEKDRPACVMTNEKCRQIVDFIRHNSHDQDITIRWFGGEPLMNCGAIDNICAGLKENGIQYRSTITTNGYLFASNVVNKAVKHWNLKKAQITLDGTERKYNEIKSYVHPDANPFVTVMGNIESLVANDVAVLIRLNMSLENVEDLCQLVSLIHDKFGENKLLKIGVCSIFELRNDANGESLDKGLRQIQDLIYKYNLDVSYEYFAKNRINHCQADDHGHSVVIFPDGNIGWCEHEMGGPHVGNVEKSNLADESLATCPHEYMVFEKCHRCALYPDCLKLASCDQNHTCLDFRMQYEFRQLLNTMRRMIDRHETKV